MGLYLSSPVTEKISSDESNDKLVYGASSMQGWRVNQEDAHNCLLNFDNDTSFFAVYDGHGGHEVAKYCAHKLPQFIKDTEEYKKGDIQNALIEGFLGFDASIATSEVIEVLSEIAGDKKVEECSEEEENVDNLYEEAAMPIEQVIEKYTTSCPVNPAVRNLKKDGETSPKSPYLIAKREGESKSHEDENDVGSSASCSSEAGPSKAGSSSSNRETCNDGVSSSSYEENEAKCIKDNKDSEEKGKNNCDVPEIKVTTETPDSSNATESSEADVKSQAKKPVQNGDASPESDVSSSSPQENGEVSKKGKGKSPMKKNVPNSPVKNLRPKRNAQQLYKQILDFKDEETDDTEDEEDKTFTCPNEDSSDEEVEGVNAEIGENSDDSSEEDEAEEEEEEEEEDDDEDDYEGEDDQVELEFARNMKEEPGSDSGCTAVVAVLKGNELYVANAGDSRCIVCRNGQAVEMSIDHKPEDEVEHERIIKAGGRVSEVGRVNGGLNLSRALGDHAYKQNQELSAREQMITALPDVKVLTLNPREDQFMVLACDGIWNSMSSQEVVDFVKERLDEGRKKVSEVCEELFDHCLAPNTMGDGTGCDNMTAIIVQFKSGMLKRASSSEPETADSKRAKTEEAESQIDTTA